MFLCLKLMHAVVSSLDNCVFLLGILLDDTNVFQLN